MRKVALDRPELLKDAKQEVNRRVGHRVAKIMRDNGWRAKAAKKYKAATNRNHSFPVAPNLLEQNFEADSPDKKWVPDITAIWTDDRLAIFGSCPCA